MARRVNLTLILWPDQPIEVAASKFRKKVATSGIAKEALRHDFFTPPSLARRKKQLAARKRFRKDHAPNGEPLYRIERERQRYGEA